ncbi:RnfABCDGE type electron transport complex subunit D [Hujiaoplasma nucleasis]|uniref:RnfABCDGE type electron transport complex subunit D n=1 Tax=Hujiaoplasma nucleasis TaxID=2725268 RepID=A0A7L6N673_9MOLU|nr:RnfABCDGE type electron transport complex subunit D [Hujiaoplasma nucleasis]QLY40767.1 RnfABCDGE type electron transport complex subunit D [Hujiaoplasma nucleasis]
MTQEMQLDLQQVPSKKNLIIFTGSLLVLLIASAFLYGLYVFAIAAVALVSGALVEWVFAKVRKLEFDISWMVSPLVLTLLMPPRVNLWIVAVATAFGIFFGKAIFGGLGRNIFNPAVVGVLFVTISFPSIITAAEWIHPSVENFTGSTPLVMLNGDGEFTYLFKDLLFGNVPGHIGETFRIGIIVLGIGLLVLKVADWRIPLAYLGGSFILTAIGHLAAPDIFPDPILSMFVGTLLFAAFFLATDPVTAPIKPMGKIVFGLGLAFFTVLIRNFATFQEGVIFAIILMNAIAPLIDDLFNKEVEESKLSEVTEQ